MPEIKSISVNTFSWVETSINGEHKNFLDAKSKRFCNSQCVSKSFLAFSTASDALLRINWDQV